MIVLGVIAVIILMPIFGPVILFVIKPIIAGIAWLIKAPSRIVNKIKKKKENKDE